MAIPGSNIRILRQQHGLSQRVLAEAVGIDVSNLSRLESGRSEGTRETIEKIAKALNVTVGVLYTEAEKVEAAVLRMRNVAVLNPEQAAAWSGPDSIDATEIERFLHVELRRASRHAFAVQLVDDSCEPIFRPGDDLVFDPAKKPRMGSFVLARVNEGSVAVGQLRLMGGEPDGSQAFAVVPPARVYAALSSREIPGLKLLGTLVESRRYYE